MKSGRLGSRRICWCQLPDRYGAKDKDIEASNARIVSENSSDIPIGLLVQKLPAQEKTVVWKRRRAKIIPKKDITSEFFSNEHLRSLSNKTFSISCIKC